MPDEKDKKTPSRSPSRSLSRSPSRPPSRALSRSPSKSAPKEKTPPKKRGASSPTGQTPQTKRTTEKAARPSRSPSPRRAGRAAAFGGPLPERSPSRSGNAEPVDRGRARSRGGTSANTMPPVIPSLSRVRSNLSNFGFGIPKKRSTSNLRGGRSDSVSSQRSQTSTGSGAAERQTKLDMGGGSPTTAEPWDVLEMDTKLAYPPGKRDQARHRSPTAEEYAKLKKMVDRRGSLHNDEIRKINEQNKKLKKGSPFIEPSGSDTIASFPNSDKLTLGVSRHVKRGDGKDDKHSEDHVVQQETKDRARPKNIENPRKRGGPPRVYAEDLLNTLPPCNTCSDGVLKEQLLPSKAGGTIYTVSDGKRRDNPKMKATDVVDGHIKSRHASNERRRKHDKDEEDAREAMGGSFSRSPSPMARFPTREPSPRSRAREDSDRRLAEHIAAQPPSEGEDEEEDPTDQGSSNPVLRRQQQQERRRRGR